MHMIVVHGTWLAGHGGPNAAEYVKQNLFINLVEHSKFSSDIASAVGEYCDVKQV